jgi:hypothetical protein
MFHQFATLLFLMCVSHAVCDYSLQNDYIAKNKSRHNNQKDWPIVLSAHALMHGGGVYFITGSLVLGLAETMAHWLIDFLKCEGELSYRQDQMFHVACKVVWVFFAISGIF